MNPLPGQLMPDSAEPKAALQAVPVWLMVLLLLLLFWGMVYFDQNSAWCNSQVYAPYHSLAELRNYQPPTGGINLERGRAVYETVCALCHNTDGTGKPGQGPPFAGSEWVLGSPTRLARIPLAGLIGPVQVKGQEYNNPGMVSVRDSLSDDDLAAVLTYIRRSWGNQASEIPPEQVKATRAEVGNRSQPWSAAELNALR
jgi:mono/diheme cytochrome c family protein